MFPKKISQNIYTLAKIHGNVFPWQPAIMVNKASFYLFMLQISLPWHESLFYNACPRHLKSRRDLLYDPTSSHPIDQSPMITLKSVKEYLGSLVPTRYP